MASKPHPLPARPTTWATITKQVPGSATPLMQCDVHPPPTREINESKNVNLALKTIDTKMHSPHLLVIGFPGHLVDPHGFYNRCGSTIKFHMGGGAA
ncbi:hypothetical protein CROQUDRAFT_100365 [Cronartium quercuum f. sp. fusiforme G11]|uniref:Uncharacterized protein n=1 Tax=Cronartium quercuum f. sp. fusiforme G11 TaxID=708437 RepID=A0A9P6N9R7_9BASI|nr:hypothetical protein CROQUDRAFT_100365 [Cronartium quercuum f. sp. fusiforme G11]